MSEKLEDFIKYNRKEFDRLEPPQDLWEHIEERLNQKQRKNRISSLSYFGAAAAVILIVLSASILFWHYRHKEDIVRTINPVLARQQETYLSLIKEKKSQLIQIRNEEPQLYHEFSSDVKKVEENYRQLKSELISSPNREETLKAMLLNLKIQAGILNQQLEIIQQINHSKKQKNETQDI